MGKGWLREEVKVDFRRFTFREMENWSLRWTLNHFHCIWCEDTYFIVSPNVLLIILYRPLDAIWLRMFSFPIITFHLYLGSFTIVIFPIYRDFQPCLFDSLAHWQNNLDYLRSCWRPQRCKTARKGLNGGQSRLYPDFIGPPICPNLAIGTRVVVALPN